MTERTTPTKERKPVVVRCEEGHPIKPTDLYCQTCRGLYIHWAYGLNAVQHAALGRALDMDVTTGKERVA